MLVTSWAFKLLDRLKANKKTKENSKFFMLVIVLLIRKTD